MYKWEKETNPRRRRTQSFSSSLLDAIYRSIDESKADDNQEQGEEEAKSYIRDRAMNMKKKQKEQKERTNLRRAIMIESWIEKQSVQSSTLSNSASSSSAESSSGAMWSSSETESTQKQRSFKTKPFRCTTSGLSSQSEKKMTLTQFEQRSSDKNQPKKMTTTKPENNGFSKTKLKALKIYGELKKVKQPISPGGRIASFINSIFNSGNVKKAKMCYVGAVEDVTSETITKSACSSASNFSRSCLSKTTSSRAKHSTINGAKRSVRFYPVNMILGEDKCVYEEDPSLMPLSSIRGYVRSSSSKEEEPRKDKGVERETRAFLRGFCDVNGEADDEEEEEDDDGAKSYSSSDLFELDHLVGIGRYREELPVYETTSLKTNQAIANGLIL